MSTAIVVKDIYKEFGKPANGHRFSWLPWRKTEVKGTADENGAEPNGANGSTETTRKNGAKAVIVAVDHVNFEVEIGRDLRRSGPERQW